jgi:heme exporter protein C
MNEQIFTITKFSDLANPTRFLALAARILPWLAGLTALVLAAGLYLSFTTDGDYQQGYTVRIMYVHVPSAWLAMMCYSVMAVSAIGTLVWRHPLADVSHKAAAPPLEATRVGWRLRLPSSVSAGMNSPYNLERNCHEQRIV